MAELGTAESFERRGTFLSGADLSLVLAVAESRINRVVLSRIVERVGLRALTAAPREASMLISRSNPATVILDGGAANDDCDHLLPMLAVQRQASPHRLPKIVLLTMRNIAPHQTAHPAIVDAVVTKPVTPDRMQPLLLTMIASLRS